jgi:hypothetical protein
MGFNPLSRVIEGLKPFNPWSDEHLWSDQPPSSDQHPWSDQPPSSDQHPWSDQPPSSDEHPWSDQPPSSDEHLWSDEHPWSAPFSMDNDKKILSLNSKHRIFQALDFLSNEK